MLDLRQLRALRAVADTGSVLAAARALDWSQPTVSHHLSALSRLTGTPVVEASSSGTVLTAAGRAWLPHAQALLDRAAQAQDDVRSELAQSRRRIRVGIFPTAAAYLLPTLVQAAGTLGLEPRITETELDGLLDGMAALRLDMAIVYGRRGGTRLPRGSRRIPLTTERLAVALTRNHPLASDPGLTLAMLRNERWILGTTDSDPVDLALFDAAQSSGFTPLPGPRSDDYRVISAYVAAGLGVALIPELALSGVNEDVVVVEIDEPDLERKVSLVAAPWIEGTAVDAIVTALRAELPPARMPSVGREP